MEERNEVTPKGPDAVGPQSQSDGAAGARSARSPGEDGAPPASAPPKVIRGTSTPGNGIAAPRTKVDYLTISCREDRDAISRCLAEVFSGAPAVPSFEQGPGKRHFDQSRRILIAGVPAGEVLTGGETQRGRACIDVSGTGCGFVQDWERAQAALLALPERSWTRADIAADFFRGELTHERVKQAHKEGKFTRGGREPLLTAITTTDRNRGRTIYIGQRGGDALGRFYEKGKKEFSESASKVFRQLAGSAEDVTVTDAALNQGEPFDLASWYRAELELRSKNRPIADDWITRRDEYFAGAYPFLAELLPEVEPRVLVRPRDRGILAIEAALERVKKQWGAVLYTGLAYCGGDYLTLCEKILATHHSRKLVQAGALLAVDERQ
ncbi:MAG TPA: replication initiation factor domain-containing protein [Burkholderiales bacterium]|nr:replication initiation factor domain-containing protein [Burkholderiales bacterium]